MLDKINDWVSAHPENGYLVVAVLLAFWLLGVIIGWKWAYESNSWNQNFLRDLLGPGMYRICIGVILAVAVGISLYLYSVTGK